ncbi:MAG: hypothetical protein KF871_17110 [Hydrogenophaga sp.]|uniref:hypothetical protein n=1 Tax=Hydrogenophaga sp. TaxID=1904254 RepID=UPI001D5C2DCC|nr:hypothetical protein [Hydrogenophaga sp.]MBX3611617.1 hypothetical protein [Hydrogenophaga sp.]
MHRRIRHAALAVALGLAAPMAALAGDCWAPDAATATPPGVWARALNHAGERMRRDPAIQAIDRVRYRLHRSVSVPQHSGAPAAAEAHVMLHGPDTWQGACGLKPEADRLHGASLSVHLNNLRAVLNPLDIGGDAQPPFFVAPTETGRRAGHPVYDGRLLVLTVGRLPAFVPVSVGEYLQAWQRQLDHEQTTTRQDAQALQADEAQWREALAQLERSDPAAAADMRRTLAEARATARGEGASDPLGERAALRALRQSLSAARLASPAYVSSAAMERQRFGIARADEPGAQALVRVNPALWQGARPGDVRVVALEVYLNRSEAFDHPDTPLQAAARGWLSRVDPAIYADLLTP